MKSREHPHRLQCNSAVRHFVLCGGAAIALLTVTGCPGLLALTDALSSRNPSVTAPANETIECDGSGNSAALNDWLDSATFTQGCGGATLTNDFEALGPGCGATGTVVVTWTVTDDCGKSGSDSARFTIVDTEDPTLTVPQPISVTCGEPGTADALTEWLESATATDTCGEASITTERSATSDDCTATITWTATDDCGNAVSSSSTYTTEDDETPPAMTLNGDEELTIECGESWQDPGVSISDDCDALIQPTVTGEVDLNLPGVYVLTYAALDACGNEGPTFERTVTVVDTTPPEVDVSDPRELWPPNHRLETLTLADLVTVEDACEGELDPNDVGIILEVYSDEPDNDTGDGNTTGDVVIANDYTFSVRVERKGNGNGRVYGVLFEISDSSGNSVEATAFVHVPHDQSGDVAVDDGEANGQVVTP